MAAKSTAAAQSWTNESRVEQRVEEERLMSSISSRSGGAREQHDPLEIHDRQFELELDAELS